MNLVKRRVAVGLTACLVAATSIIAGTAGTAQAAGLTINNVSVVRSGFNSTILNHTTNLTCPVGGIVLINGDATRLFPVNTASKADIIGAVRCTGSAQNVEVSLIGPLAFFSGDTVTVITSVTVLDAATGEELLAEAADTRNATL